MKKYILLLLTLILLIPVSAVSAVKDVGSYAEVDRYIDPSLPEKDKQILREVMLNLDKEDRKNVFYINEADGFFTANKVEALKEFKVKYKNLINTDGKLKKDPNYVEPKYEVEKEAGLVSTLAYLPPTNVCPTAHTGPFRRVKSKIGYSRVNAYVYLPQKGTEAVMTPKSKTVNGVTKMTGDTAYMYLGAINTATGQQVDAGLSLNYGDGIPPVNPTEETWAMTWLGMDSIASGSPANFKMGTTAFMKFYIPANNQAALYVSGTAKNGLPLEQTMVWNVLPNKQFTPSGANMLVKRVTSIAQSIGYEDFTTGSYLNNARWSNVNIGTTAGSETPWNASHIGTGTSGDPSHCGYKANSVLIDWVSWSEETIKIKTGILP
ncbi:hypothetical protein I6N90_13290 [Paenibacillus sp. GSMTC-2017]|uniref:hypothetical protein n=1 Tax=Paenibacillus sp. GSMTC-2017 TaxID=2794350 RepID=UPI0018D9A5CC|nr:hypothetical protein [Paenibacillus sp. GSMTC-2017]MBH5318775.1 hypothetical protein [Paenibacillus sp. GSMTC-2017]